MKYFLLLMLTIGAVGATSTGENFRAATDMMIQAWLKGEPFMIGAFSEDIVFHGAVPPIFGGPFVGQEGLANFFAQIPQHVDITSFSYDIRSVDASRRSVEVQIFPKATIRKTGKAADFEHAGIFHFQDDSALPLVSYVEWISYKAHQLATLSKPKAQLAFEAAEDAFYAGDIDKAAQLCGSLTMTFHGADYNPFVQIGAVDFNGFLTKFLPISKGDVQNVEVLHATDDVFIFIFHYYPGTHLYIPNGREMPDVHATVRLTNGVLSSMDMSFVEEPSRYTWFPSIAPPDNQ